MTPAAKPAARTLPPPLVRFKDDKIRWIRIKAELLVAAVVLAHIGTLIIVAIYYLLFELNPTMTHWWHTVVSNSDLRHSIRDVAEGVLGGFMAQAIVWNHFRKQRPDPLEKLEKRLHIPERLAAPFFALLYGAIGFVAAYYALHALGVHATQAAATHSSWARVEGIWRSGGDKKLMGFVASLLARRPMRPIFDSVQLWFAERRYDQKKNVHWYHPPTFKARYNAIAESGEIAADKHGRWQSVVMIGALVIGIGLAAYGYYVLSYIAKTATS